MNGRREDGPRGGEAAVAAAVALRESRGQWILPDVFARRLGLAEAGLRAVLRGLKQAGFRIDVRPGGALRLIAGPDGLDPRELLYGLDTQVVGRRVAVQAQATSTNDLAWASLEAGEPEGGCFFAEYQTDGRGRQGRRWIAPAGTALLMSVGLWPTGGRGSRVGGRRGASGGTPDSQTFATALTFAASVATAEAITAATNVPCAIEWPNDVTCGDRKVAGILVEGRRLRLGGKSAASACVVGVGINVNGPLTALPVEVRPVATSLAAEAGGPVDRVLVARRLIRALDTWYGVVSAGDVALVQKRWLELSATVGRRLRIVQDGRTFEGEVVDVSATDGLALRLDYGEIRRVQPESATVLIRWPR